MTTVLISGLGLIGSSIARIIREGDDTIEIIGSDPNDDSSEFLLQHHIINSRAKFIDAVPNADIIILAARFPSSFSKSVSFQSCH